MLEREQAEERTADKQRQMQIKLSDLNKFQRDDKTYNDF